MPLIQPHPENELIEPELIKIDKVYADGWDVYDTADRISQSMAGIGNLLRALRNNLEDPAIAAQLKKNTDDINLILYLERIEDTLLPCEETLIKCEETIRTVRNGLVQINYKKTIPQTAADRFNHSKSVTEEQ